MKHRVIGLLIGLTIVYAGFSQQKAAVQAKNQFVDIAATVGNSQGSAAASYVYNWKLGKYQKWEIGLGARATTNFGTKLDFTTAGPAKLTRGTSTPFAVVVAPQKTENWDTLTVQRPLTTSFNVTLNFGYHFNKRLSGGTNIDLVGFTAGRSSSAIFTSNGNTQIEPIAKPSSFNLLLTGDNDLGSLNSEFFLKYQLNSHWSIRAIYQFLFTEYKTTTLHQTAPDGTAIYRFRNKANNFGIGISYLL
ncbi:hypothetical protein [Parasediminibacterium sp. JCM 36343]|uniref:hypothetical protein n=1 Tax=Parasediminibacterium sp. JCM 36343 TaxID=3374279 RepID=UPI00397C6C73